MPENEVLGRIHELVAEEHRLRDQVSRGELDSAEEKKRLAVIEVALDQCWDLLRQRRALRASGLDPDEAQSRPADEVEGYLQ